LSSLLLAVPLPLAWTDGPLAPPYFTPFPSLLDLGAVPRFFGESRAACLFCAVKAPLTLRNLMFDLLLVVSWALRLPVGKSWMTTNALSGWTRFLKSGQDLSRSLVPAQSPEHPLPFPKEIYGPSSATPIGSFAYGALTYRSSPLSCQLPGWFFSGFPCQP